MISVIIPVHNTEKYIDECIKSVINQTYKDLEIICIVSGSDESLYKIEEYKKNDKRIHIIRDENSSYGYKINIGIQKSKGDYIAIVDSDDYIDEKMYMDMISIMEENNLDYIKSNYTSFYTQGGMNVLFEKMNCINNGEVYNKVICVDNNASILSESNICIWSGLYSKRFIIDNNIKLNETKGASFQDAGFALITNLYANRVYFMSNSYYRYRIDNTSSSVKDDKKSLIVFDEIKWIDKQLSKHTSINYERVWNTKKRIIDILYWNYNRLEENDAVKFSNAIKEWLKYEFIESKRIDDLQNKLKEEVLTMYCADNEHENGCMEFFKERNISICHCVPDEIEVTVIVIDNKEECVMNETLLSILKQEIREMEIQVLCFEQNKSCNKYIEMDKRINLITADNKRRDYYVNKLIKQSKGKYIMILHSSELLYDDALNQILRKIHENDSDAIFFLCDCYKNNVCYLSNESELFNVLPILIKKSVITDQNLYLTEEMLDDISMYMDNISNSILNVYKSDCRWMKKMI